jgi:hypothetical protein
MYNNYKINNHDYLIHSRSANSRTGFAHISTLVRDGIEIATKRVNYYNRTWESYQYQTSMILVVEQAMDAEMKSLIDHYKRESGIKRLSAAKKEELSNSTTLMLDLKELRKQL